MIADASLVPDLSHLSAEERAIIEEVFQRQRAEERKEEELSVKAEKELEDIDRQINERSETARRLVGTQDDAICQICQKTKFADGIGHKCFYCQLRSCARCGGRTTSKNKNIWACSLCQKRQSILAKTGKWIDLGQKPESGTGQSSPTHSQTDSFGKPLPGQTADSGTIPNSISGTIASAATAMLSRRQSNPKVQQNHVQQNNIQPAQQNHIAISKPMNQGPQQAPYQETVRNGPLPVNNVQAPVYDQPPFDQTRQQHQQIPQQHQQIPQQQQQQVKRQGTLPKQIEMETNGHHIKLNGAPPQMSTTRSDYPSQDRPPKSSRHQGSPRRSPQQERDRDRERSYDRDRDKAYIEHDLHPASANGPRQPAKDYRDTREARDYRDGRVSPRSDRRDDRDRRDYREDRDRTKVHRKISDTRRQHDYRESRMNRSFDYDEREDYPTDSDPSYRKNSSYELDRRSHPDRYDKRSPSPRNGKTGRTGRKKDMTPNLQPAPPIVPPLEMPQAPPGHSPLALRQRKNKHNKHQTTSSSEDDVPSTSGEAKPGDDFTEKDLLRYIYGSESIKSIKRGISDFGRSKLTGELLPADKPPSQVIPGDTLAAKIRNYLSNPVSWQPTADNRRLIGHMILSRNQANNGDLGLKVVGGRHSGTRRLGAFITRVKPGSVADAVGQLRAGDEVLEWNGKSMQGISYQRVCDIINASKNDPRIELIVSRSLMTPGGDDFLNVQRSLPNPAVVMAAAAAAGAPPGIYDDFGYTPIEPILPHSQSVMASQLNQLGQQPLFGSPHKYSTPTISMSADDPMLMRQQIYGSKTQIFGRIEISLLYLPHERELVVTIHRATDLPPRPDGNLRNPYVKLFLLPDRSEKSRRQSAVLAETLSPYWNETFYYRGLTEPELMSRILEVTVWDYDQYEANAFLGETLIDFSTAILDNQPFSYTLVDMDDENPVRLRLRRRRYSSQSQGPPTRPYSEMGYREPGYHRTSDPRSSGGYPIRPGVNDDYAVQYPQEGPINDYNIRRSRTYDRAGIYSAGASDWNINSNNGNGYLAEHNFANQYKERRRPRSATAMRRVPEQDQNGRPWTGRGVPQDIMEDGQYPQETYPQQQYQQHHQHHQQQLSQQPPSAPPPGYIDPRTPNGRLKYEAMQESQGYGSDGSETLSVNSAQSMQNRAIRRHQASSEEGDGSSQSARQQQAINEEEDMIENAAPGLGKPKTAREIFQEQKERKKSVLTKFIPGRGGQGDIKRTGFARSEEVGIPDTLLNPNDRLIKQVSKDSNDSGQSDRYPILPDAQLGGFMTNLGHGQVVGRQALASPVLGEVQLAINFSNVTIDIEIIRAKNLVLRPGTRVNPAPYVKIYLMEGKNVVAKAKTQPANKTTAPLFQTQVHFDASPRHKMLQITVLGDYGRMDKKAFIGIAQIKMDDLDPQMRPINAWYKLFHNTSLAGTAPVRKDSETSLNEIK